jgi:putative transposase
MKKSRFSERQIVKILQEHESGVRASDLCRQHNISEGTFYNWKKKFSGMDSICLFRTKYPGCFGAKSQVISDKVPTFSQAKI